MSDSRLEKFIYAICSMDVSDLPVPLSRIEKLWNCLITGETPDFEPLSRNEKYLMAMLDRYDISNLPAPMSRGEKLLYKIAVGETDLSDVPGYLSRYEELLKYLIENGVIGFEYVLYTLNQSLSTLYSTAEKPVKSAILKGNTLVNIVNGISLGTGATETDNSYVLTQTDSVEELRVVLESSLIELNKDYTFIYYIQEKTTTKQRSLVVKNLSYLVPGNNTVITQNIGWNKVKFNVSSFGSNPRLNIAISSAEENGVYVKFAKDKFALLSGDWTQKELPFDILNYGMQSVKLPVLTTTGKNLFNPSTEIITGYGIRDTSGFLYDAPDHSCTGFIRAEPNTTYVITQSHLKTWIFAYNKNKKYINMVKKDGTSGQTFLTTDDTYYIRFDFNTIDTSKIINDFQLEKGSTATSYEPYKTNILTAKEDVVLRGIGNVKDELNLSTGEVVERIGEVVLDSSWNWVMSDNSDYRVFYINMKIYNYLNIKPYSVLVSSYYPYSTSLIQDNCISCGGAWGFQVRKPLEYTMEEFKNELIQNQITVQYQLGTESIKTVDLTTVDQDNQPTKLGTFENVTHVSLESAGLIPKLEMEVATRISKELASASPLMDDISTEQQQLEATVDEQSNNVDATMIATTEIYEETL